MNNYEICFCTNSALLLNGGHDSVMAVCCGKLISPIQRLWHGHFMAGHDACNVRGAKCAYDRNEKTSHTEMGGTEPTNFMV